MRDVAINYLSERLYKLSTNNNDGNGNDSGNDNNGVEILACLEPRLLRRVLQCDKLVSGTSEQISILVAKYLQLYTNNCQSSTTTNNNNNRNNNKVINSFTNVTLPSLIINNNTEPTTATIASAVLTDEDFYWLTHCQIMPRIDPTEAIYYFAYAATYFPRILVEVGSGSLKSRCLLACSLSSSCSVDEDTTKKDRKKDESSSSTNVVLDNLTSYIEQRGITTDDNPSSQQQQQQQPSSNMMIESYINLDYRYKVQLLESTLVGAKKQLNAKTKQYNIHTAMYDEVQQTENIMYKKNTMKTLSSALTSPSMSSINTGIIDNYNDTVVSKAVVLGCGILSANGLYLSSSTPTNKMMGGDSVTIYEREGIWDGQHVTFVLYPVTLGQYYLQYKLGVRNCTPETREDNCDNNHSGVAKKKKKIRILYNSPKIVIGDHATSFNGSGGQYHCNNRGGNQQQQQIIIPEGEWEIEQQVNGSDGIGVPMSEDISPAPQFVGRVEQ
jgi:hypothetical protein